MAVPDLPAFTRLLGVNVLHRSPERTEAELAVRAELCNRRGVLHGGAVMALGDMLGGMTARVSLPDGGRAAMETRITRGDGKLAAIVTQTQLIFDNNDTSE
jgi:1,4-dihydroxy-2-naphthoyl-CoA hydrolase